MKNEIKTEGARIARLPSWEFSDCGDSELIKGLSEASLLLAESKLTPDKPRWLTLSGDSGAGKTHLAKKIHRFWTHKFRGEWRTDYKSTNDYRLQSVRFFKWADLMGMQFDTARDHMRQTDFLTIDDIGSMSGTSGMNDFEMARLSELLQHRENKWTVLTTNLSLDDFGKIDVRFSDRMLRNGSQFVGVKTKSFTMRQREARK